MRKEYIKIPKNVLSLAYEVKRAVDDYWKRLIAEEELKELLIIWADISKLIDGNSFNKTVTKICGKARMKVIENLLKDHLNN